MNILVVPYGRSPFYFRSDSTLIRAIDKYYIPDYVKAVSILPIVYFKCSRPGKAVDVKFASRFIDAFGYGVLICPEMADNITDCRDFISNSLDYTSHIPLDIFPISEYGKSLLSAHPLSVMVNGKPVFTDLKNPDNGQIHKSISDISALCSTRVGDFIAFELAAPMPVTREQRITVSVSGKQIIGFTIL